MSIEKEHPTVSEQGPGDDCDVFITRSRTHEPCRTGIQMNLVTLGLLTEVHLATFFLQPSDPRACVVHFFFVQHQHLQKGSKIIPACAGNTAQEASSTHARSDHPRTRGEHLLMTRCAPVRGGPSPHTRGTPRSRDRSWDFSRTIPACAGKPQVARRRTVLHWDHPRIRGEHGA